MAPCFDTFGHAGRVAFHASSQALITMFRHGKSALHREREAYIESQRNFSAYRRFLAGSLV